MLWDLLELVLEGSSTLATIQTLFNEIYSAHSEPDEYTHREKLKALLFSDNDEKLGDPTSQRLTEIQENQILSHILNWRMEHFKMVLKEDKIDATFFSVGSQYSDVFDSRKLISSAWKVYEELKQLYEERCSYLTRYAKRS